MERFRCGIAKDGILVVERILNKNYYYKFDIREIGWGWNHKRAIIINPGKNRICFTLGYYEVPIKERLVGRITQQTVNSLIENSY